MGSAHFELFSEGSNIPNLAAKWVNNDDRKIWAKYNEKEILLKHTGFCFVSLFVCFFFFFFKIIIIVKRKKRNGPKFSFFAKCPETNIFLYLAYCSYVNYIIEIACLQ